MLIQFGFFVTVGPLQVFVSKHVYPCPVHCSSTYLMLQQIPSEYELDNSVAPPAFVSTEDPSARIAEGSEVMDLAVYGFD